MGNDKQENGVRLQALLCTAAFALAGSCLSSISEADCIDSCGPELRDNYSVVTAKCKWNNVGITVEKGQAYQITTSGLWQDKNISRDARGYTSDAAEIPTLWQPLFRYFERWRRAPEAKWFSLICTVNLGGEDWIDFGNILEDSSGEEGEFTAPETGTLYCAANDLSFMYGNNCGSILLKIRPAD